MNTKRNGKPRKRRTVTGRTPKLTADRAEVWTRSCVGCIHKDRCYDRVRNNKWVLCEIPDELDLVVANAEKAG